ncbi:GntR family transcriptional regulator [Leifsonia poae]|uniref:GntR family transcriptional regulator n=1 Tax=Leifsonia poae TaxID=110933 RepID=UPI001CBC5BD4|nr:GntR family transcriptional regulator [Leifsonia poae]
MDVHVPIEGRGDRVDRIYRHLREAIRDGRLRLGERLPSTRDLAAQLAVSRTTVTVAYERLGAEGYLLSRVGSGTFVAAVPTPLPRSRARDTHTAALPTARWRGLDDPLWTEPVPIAYDFSVGSPDPALFPLATWRRYVTAELRGGILRAGTTRIRPGSNGCVASWPGIWGSRGRWTPGPTMCSSPAAPSRPST